MRADAIREGSGRPARPPLAWLIYLLFAAGLALSICAVKLSVGGVPFRAMCFFGAAGLLVLTDARGLIEDMYRARQILLLITAFAILGFFVSVAVGTGVGSTLHQIIEIHVQALITTMLAFAVTRWVGVGPVVVAFVAPVMLSGVFAIAQALGLDAAWQARALIGRLMHDPELTQDFYVRRYRALGLSYSPVHLGTQACLAFAAVLAWRLWRNPKLMSALDIPLLIMLVICAVFCIASGNRSPLLGFVAFFIIYGLIAEPRRVLLVLPLLMIVTIAGVELMSVLADEGARFAQTDDGSAEGRATLAKYGRELILDRPLGYGLHFNSTDHWQNYAHSVIYDENSMAIRRWPPHNYLIMILAKYGILAIPLAFLAFPRRRLGWIGWLAFIPYGVHVYFHNEGPLQSDNLIWSLIPAFILVIDRLAAAQPVRVDTRPWTRAVRARTGTREAGHA